MAEPTLYERLGGIFAIAAVVDNFSDRLLKNPTIVQANPTGSLCVGKLVLCGRVRLRVCECLT